MTLEDIEPGVFNAFVEWLYTQKLPGNLDDWQRVVGELIQYYEVERRQPKVYAFADRFIVPGLRQLLNHALVPGGESPRYRSPLRYTDMAYAFNNLPSEDSVLDYFVDLFFMRWGWKVHSWSGQESFSSLPDGFLLKILENTGKERQRVKYRAESPFMMDWCSYHLHTSDEERAECPHNVTDWGGKIWWRRELKTIQRPEGRRSTSGRANFWGGLWTCPRAVQHIYVRISTMLPYHRSTS